MALGLDWPAYCRFIDNLGPVTTRVLEALYDSATSQIMAVALLLGFIGRPKRLAEFMGCLVLTGVVAIVTGAIIPALGAHHAYGMNTTAPFVSEIVAAHAGRVDRIDIVHMQGLVTFPSYHTVISIQIIVATWRLRLIGPVMAIINAARLVGVPIFGSHHFIDMIGGGVLAGLVTWLWRVRFAEPTTEKAPAAAAARASAV